MVQDWINGRFDHKLWQDYTASNQDLGFTDKHDTK
jgi:hypothetical protein